jgi:hypothetical protein
MMNEFKNMHKECGEVDWHDCVHFCKDYAEKWGANEVIGANYTVTNPFLKTLLIFSSN